VYFFESYFLFYDFTLVVRSGDEKKARGSSQNYRCVAGGMRRLALIP
jgi:hypothetical protein